MNDAGGADQAVSLEGRRVLVGVSGGIAAFKTAALVSSLVQNGADVTVVMTDSARRFVGEATFAALTGRPVPAGLFETDQHPLGAHIELSREADLLCIAPATANLIGKLANGLADDLLSTLYLCYRGPVVVAPAMNCEMWESSAVQRNMAQLAADGVHSVGPGEGWLSCRDRGAGRMSEPAEILESILSLISPE